MLQNEVNLLPYIVDRAYEKGMPIPEVLKMSAKASSIAVTREGAGSSIPYRTEVLGALQA